MDCLSEDKHEVTFLTLIFMLVHLAHRDFLEINFSRILSSNQVLIGKIMLPREPMLVRAQLTALFMFHKYSFVVRRVGYSYCLFEVKAFLELDLK